MPPKKSNDKDDKDNDKGKGPLLTKAKKTNLKKVKDHRVGNLKASSSRQLTKEQWSKINQIEKKKIDKEFTKENKQQNLQSEIKKFEKENEDIIILSDLLSRQEYEELFTDKDVTKDFVDKGGNQGVSMRIKFNRFLSKPLDYWMYLINKKVDQASEDIKHFQFGVNFQDGSSEFLSAKNEIDFYKKLEGMIQSGDDRGAVNFITISLLNFKKINGKGQPLSVPKSVEELKQKKSCITVKDEQCFAKSCIIMNYKDKKDNEEITYKVYNHICNNIKNRLTREAIILMKELEFNAEDGIGFDDIHVFEEKFDKNITIHGMTDLGCTIMYPPSKEGLPDRPEWNFVYYHLNSSIGHYEPITKIEAFYGIADRPRCFKCKSKLCDFSKKGTKPFIDWKKAIPCEDCNIKFPNQKCYDLHLKSTACLYFHRCKGECKKVYDIRKEQEHICGHEFCPNCKLYCDMRENQCYITPKKPKDVLDEGKIGFF